MSLFRQGLSVLLTGLIFCVGWTSCQLSLNARPVTDEFPYEIARIPNLQVSQLPAEAKKTLNLIYRGGPFPYRQDGTIFGNREGRLPKKPRGYYREYTVPTPGASNRGARRFVVGQNGEIYYTSDHYKSFFRVIR
jgi:guanyl-specific ribonuclease Sa